MLCKLWTVLWYAWTARERKEAWTADHRTQPPPKYFKFQSCCEFRFNDKFKLNKHVIYFKRRTPCLTKKYRVTCIKTVKNDTKIVSEKSEHWWVPVYWPCPGTECERQPRKKDNHDPAAREKRAGPTRQTSISEKIAFFSFFDLPFFPSANFETRKYYSITHPIWRNSELEHKIRLVELQFLLSASKIKNRKKVRIHT